MDRESKGMKTVLKFVAWMVVLSFISFIHLFFAMLNLTLTDSDGSISSLSFFLEQIILFAVPVIPTLIFQLSTHYIKKLSFENFGIRLLVMMSPLPILFILFLISFRPPLDTSFIPFILGIALYYLFVSFVGDRVRMWIEARGKKK